MKNYNTIFIYINILLNIFFCFKTLKIDEQEKIIPIFDELLNQNQKFCITSENITYDCFNNMSCENQICNCSNNYYGNFCEFENNPFKNNSFPDGKNFTIKNISEIKYDKYIIFGLSLGSEINISSYDIEWNFISFNGSEYFINNKDIYFRIPKNISEFYNNNLSNLVYVTLTSNTQQYQSFLSYSINQTYNSSIENYIEYLEKNEIKAMNDNITFLNLFSNNYYKFRFGYTNKYNEIIIKNTKYFISDGDNITNTFPQTNSFVLDFKDPYNNNYYYYLNISINKFTFIYNYTEIDSLNNLINNSNSYFENEEIHKVYSLLYNDYENFIYIIYDCSYYHTLLQLLLNTSCKIITNEKNETNIDLNTIFQVITLLLEKLYDFYLYSESRIVIEFDHNILKEIIDIFHEIVSLSVNNTLTFNNERIIIGIFRNVDYLLFFTNQINNQTLYKEIEFIMEDLISNLINVSIINGEIMQIICPSINLLILKQSRVQNFIYIDQEYFNINSDKNSNNCMLNYLQLTNKENCDENDLFCMNIENYNNLNKELQYSNSTIKSLNSLSFVFIMINREKIKYYNIYNYNNDSSIYYYKTLIPFSVKFYLYDTIGNKTVNEKFKNFNYSFSFRFNQSIAYINNEINLKNSICTPISSIFNENIYCKTYHNLSNSENKNEKNNFFNLICKCQNNLEILGLYDSNVSEYYETLIYEPKNKKYINQYFIFVSFVTILGILLIGLFLSIHDCLDDKNSQKIRKEPEILRLKHDYESCINLTDSNSCQQVFYILLYSLSFFEVTNLYFYNSPRFMRYSIYLLINMAGLTASLFPFYFFGFRFKETLINNRLIENEFIDYDNLPLQLNDLLSSTALIVVVCIFTRIITALIFYLLKFSHKKNNYWYYLRDSAEKFTLIGLRIELIFYSKKWQKFRNKVNGITVLFYLYNKAKRNLKNIKSESIYEKRFNKNLSLSNKQLNFLLFDNKKVNFNSLYINREKSIYIRRTKVKYYDWRHTQKKYLKNKKSESSNDYKIKTYSYVFPLLKLQKEKF